jgi:molybdate transport system ATP-binding protein
MSLVVDARTRIGDLALDVQLRVGDDEVVAVLGPNGAGKTTLLRIVAGLHAVDAGRVEHDGVTLDDPVAGVFVPPRDRSVGFVFQDGALFPFLDARDNIAFGLRCRGIGRRAAAQLAQEWLARVGLQGRERSRPHELSGGEAQRVALARALAPAPRLLLLDEPLAALDAAVRPEMRRLLRDQLAAFGGTRLLVTHDPVDAATLADRIVIVEGGRVVQSGTLAEVSAHPRSRYVADLVGLNLYRGRSNGQRVVLEGGGELFVAGAPAGEVFALVHPHAVTVHRRFPEGSTRNVWTGRIDEIDTLGARVRLRIAGTPPVVAELTPAAAHDLELAIGTQVWIALKATEVQAFPV